MFSTKQISAFILGVEEDINPQNFASSYKLYQYFHIIKGKSAGRLAIIIIKILVPQRLGIFA